MDRVVEQAHEHSVPFNCFCTNTMFCTGERLLRAVCSYGNITRYRSGAVRRTIISVLTGTTRAPAYRVRQWVRLAPDFCYPPFGSPVSVNAQGIGPSHQTPTPLTSHLGACAIC
jgi:hypothetical protein